MKVKKVNLNTIGSGVLNELFEEDFAKILANIADENTKAETTRELVFKIKIKPKKNRGTADLEINSTTKLAPVKPFEGSMILEMGQGGIEAYEQEGLTQPDLDNISKFKQEAK